MQMLTDAMGAMPREAVQGEEEAQARMWAWSTFKGHAEKEGLQRRARRCCWEVGGNQENGDSKGKGSVARGPRGLQDQVSQKSILWDWRLGTGD